MTKMAKIIIFTLIILASCSGNHYTDELEKIDSLKMVLNETELLIGEIDIKRLKEMHSIFKENSENIKKYYTKADEEGWEIICRYTDMKKPFRSVVEYYENFQSEIIYSRAQLDSLYHDLNHNLLNEDLVSKYLADEEKAIGSLHNMVSNNLISSEVLIIDFDSLNTLTEKIIEKIKLTKTFKN